MKWIFPYLMTLVLMYGLASTVPSTLAQSQIDHQPTAPNIILIVADDLGYGELCQVEQSVGYDRSTKKKTSKSSGQFQWTPDRSVNRFRPGYPLLEGVEHFSIQLPSVDAGAYHHHPQIAVFQGQFVACWSTHQSGEDGPGQYVRYARSNDGKAWQAPAELFPSIDKMQVSSGKGLGLTALRFVGVNQKLFAVAEAHQNTGFITADQLMTSAPASDTRSDQFSKRCRKGLGRLIREVTSPEKLGDIFWITDDAPSSREGFIDYPVATKNSMPELDAIKARLKSPLHAPTWDFKDGTTEIRAADGVLLTEPTTYRTPKGTFVKLWRAQNDCFRMYGQTSVDAKSWTAPEITPIPDAPAKTVGCSLDSKTVALIGNQVFNRRGARRDPLVIALSNDGLHFDRAFALRWRTPKFRTVKQQEEPDGRGRGFQYPSAVVKDGDLWVIYSVNKESIDISRISVETLVNFLPCGFFSAACISEVVKQSDDRFKGVVFDNDAILKGATWKRRSDGSYRLKLAWDLKKGRRPIRFIHICDSAGKILRQADQNKALFQTVTDERTVLDSIRITAEELLDASYIAVGFFGPKRKNAPIVDSSGEKVYKLKLPMLEN